MLKVFAIESSCDETSAAIVTEKKEILANITISQLEQHQPYGGVVPEIAARAHLENISPIIQTALAKAEMTFDQIDAIGVTGGPGLIGGVIVGVMVAKAISSVAKKPLIAVNHLEGHALTARLTNEVAFPYLLLLISGGHCQILVVKGVGQYIKLGGTIDDALGEAFDKVAKMLAIPYPGGPEVEKRAKLGDDKRFLFPRVFKGRKDCDFSFSGLKTAVKRQVDMLGEIDDMARNNICASFQLTVSEIIIDRLNNAIKICQNQYPEVTQLVVAGGVAANQYIKHQLMKLTEQYNWSLVVPPPSLCTDNGAMIAWAALERYRLGMIDDLSFIPKAVWPLT